MSEDMTIEEKAEELTKRCTDSKRSCPAGGFVCPLGLIGCCDVTPEKWMGILKHRNILIRKEI